MKLSKKTFLTVVSVVLALALVIGGTLAYLMDVSGEVKNEFEKNKVSVELDETTDGYDIVPGTEEEKDPTVSGTTTLPAYVFVKVNDQTEGLVEWAIADGWTLVPGYTDVYYREVDEDDSPFTFPVLAGNKVSYPDDITNEDMEAAGDDISLTFKAYIIQKAPFEGPAEAWEQAKAAGLNLPKPNFAWIDPPADALTDQDQGWTGNLNVAAEFTAPADPELEQKDYKDWPVDFTLSFNKDIPDGSLVHLFGNYGAWGWLGDDLAAGGKDSLAADEEFKIMGEWFLPAVGIGDGNITYSDVVNLVQDFKCGVAVDDEDLKDGLIATLKLIITDPATGETYTLKKLTHDFTEAEEEPELPEPGFAWIAPPAEALNDQDGGWSGNLDVAAEFTADAEAADLEGKDYANWITDFTLSFNKAIPDGSKVHLFGNYGAYGWLGDDLAAGGKDSLAADEEFKIMGEWFLPAIGIGDGQITYTDVVTMVQDFKCGVAVDDAELKDGLVATLKLIITDPEGNTYALKTLTHDFTDTTPDLPTSENVQLSMLVAALQGQMTDADESWTGNLDVAAKFTARDEPADLEGKDYADWITDFTLSFNKAIPDGSKVHLFGNYGTWGWLGDDLAAGGVNSLAAGQEIKIMADWFLPAIGIGNGQLTYTDVVTSVQQFKCGIAVDDANLKEGLIATLKLVITDPDTNATYVIIFQNYILGE